MSREIVRVDARPTTAAAAEAPSLPAIVRKAGGNARFAYDEFFAGEENSHTERAYRHAVHRFLDHCDSLGISLPQVTPGLVSDYVKNLQAEVKTRRGEQQKFKLASKPMKKLHLAGIRKFFDKLVERHAIVLNPSLSVRAPKHSVTKGKTPPLSVEQAREVLRSIETDNVVGLRDRAIVGVLIYTAARGGAVAGLRVGDYSTDGRQWFFRFEEKGGKVRDIPARHDLETFVREYVAVAGIDQADAQAPLFRTTVRKTKTLTTHPMTGGDILRMAKRRFRDAGLPMNFRCHSFRAGTATDLLAQGIELKEVQRFLGHADPRTTQLYDHTDKEVTRNLVERISI